MYSLSVFSFLKSFIPANKAPPMANVTASDFQETGYWGRDFKTKATSKTQTFNHTEHITVVFKYQNGGPDIVQCAERFMPFGVRTH